MVEKKTLSDHEVTCMLKNRPPGDEIYITTAPKAEQVRESEGTVLESTYPTFGTRNISSGSVQSLSVYEVDGSSTNKFVLPVNNQDLFPSSVPFACMKSSINFSIVIEACRRQSAMFSVLLTFAVGMTRLVLGARLPCRIALIVVPGWGYVEWPCDSVNGQILRSF